MVYIRGDNGAGYSPIQITRDGVPVVFNTVSSVFKSGDNSNSNSSQNTVWSQPYNAQELASKANQGEALTDEERKYLRSRGYTEIAGERTVYTKKHYAGGLFDSQGNYTGNGRYTYYDSLDWGSNVVSSRQEAVVYWERADNPDSISLTQKLDSFENKLRVSGINTFGSTYNKLAVYPHRLKDWANEGLQSQAEDIEYTWLSEESAKAPGWINPRIGQVADWYQNTVLDNIGIDALKDVPLYQMAYRVPDVLAGAQRMVSYGSTLIPGVETIVKRPESLAYSVALVPEALYQTWEYGLNNPNEFAVDMALGAVVGVGVSKGLKTATRAVSERLPTISMKATPQDVLLKVELPKTPKTIASEGIKYTEAEYVGQGMGKDIFKLSEKMQGDLVTIPEKGPTIDVLVGKETKAGTQEVFFKLTDEQARTIGDNYFVKSRDINIGGKSYLELTPIEKMSPSSGIQATDAPRVATPKYVQIGKLTDISSSSGINNPIRLETKVKAAPAELEFKSVDARMQLPEYTQEIEVKSSFSSDFNIYDHFKTPGTEQAPIVEFRGNIAEGWIKRESLQAGESIKRLTGPSQTYQKLSFSEWADNLGKPAQKPDIVSTERTLISETIGSIEGMGSKDLLQSSKMQPIREYVPQLEPVVEKSKAQSTITFKEPASFRLQDYFEPKAAIGGSIEAVGSKDLLQSSKMQPIREYASQLEPVVEKSKAQSTITFKEPASFRLQDYFKPMDGIKISDAGTLPGIKQTAAVQSKAKEESLFMPLPALSEIPQIVPGQTAFKEPYKEKQQDMPRILSIDTVGIMQTGSEYKKNPFAVFTPAPFPTYSPAPVSTPVPVNVPGPATGPALNPLPFPEPTLRPAPFPISSPGIVPIAAPISMPVSEPAPDPIPFPKIPIGKITIFRQGPPPTIPGMEYMFRTSNQPLPEDKRRQSQPVLSLDLRTAVNGMKFNKFYNPLESMKGIGNIGNQLSKQFRRGF